MRSPAGAFLRSFRADPRVADATVALLLLAAMIIGFASKAPMQSQHPYDTLAYVMAVGLAAPFATHRRWPMVSLVVCLSCLLVYSAIGYAAFPGINAFVLLFGVALHGER